MRPNEPSLTVGDLCDVIGRKVIARHIGVGLTQVSNAAVEGRFPAKWFDVIEKLCARRGVDCPRELFSFTRLPAAETSEDAA